VGETWNSPIGQDIVWRIKTPAAIPLLGKLIAQSQQAQTASRFFRALDFYPTNLTHPTLLSLMDGQHPQQEQITYYAIKGMETSRIMKSARIRRTLDGLLSSLYPANPTAYLDLVEDLSLEQENERLFELAMTHPAEEMGQRATRLLRQNDGLSLFEDALRDDDPTVLMAALTSLGAVSNDQSIDLLQNFVNNESHPMHLRKTAIQHMGNGWQGESRLEEWLLAAPELPEELLIAGATRLLGANRERIRTTASEFLQLEEGEDLPPIHELIAMTGESAAGQQLFGTYCSACHQVKGAGIDFGPNLSEIGSKLSKEALFGSIINPSAGISFGYEGHLVKTKDGQTYLGFLSSQTENEVSLRVAGGNNIPLQRSQIESMEMQDQSLMTAGLHKIMEPADLVNLVEYLASLKKEEALAAQ
jgi:putative heme-binding domain-containing protein